MKKKILLVVLGALLVMSLVACKEKEGKEKETKVKDNVAVADIMANISKNANVSEFSKDITKDELGYIYLDLDMNNVSDAASKIIADNKVDEITVIKATAGKTAEIEKAFKDRVESQKEISKAYDTAQYERLCDSKNYVIKTVGNYVILSIANDNDKVIKAFEDSITE